MKYRIVIDGYDCFGDESDLILLSPVLTMELNLPGSLEFTLPHNHRYYNTPRLMLSEVLVYENDELIWYGRISEISIDYYKRKKVYCEGALAYLNDSVQNGSYTNTTIANVFRTIIDNHNSLCGNWHNFSVTNVDIPYIVKEMEYKFDSGTTTWTIIKNFLSDFGGYLTVTKSGSVNNIQWTLESPVTSVHEITFGVNLKDLTQKYSINNIKTSVIPYGRYNDADHVLLNYLNSSNRIYIDSDAVNTYGRIVGVVDVGDVNTIDQIRTLGITWLNSQQFDSLSLSINAIDLYNYIRDLDLPQSVKNSDGGGFNPIDKFPKMKVGQKIHLVSTPHLIDKSLPISKIEIKLDTSLKTLSIGNKDSSLSALSGKSDKKIYPEAVVTNNNEEEDPIPIWW